MKIKTKNAALASITVIWTTARGKKYPQYQADLGVYDGRRVRITRNRKSECERAVEAWYNQRRASGDSIVQLRPAQLAEAIIAFDFMRRKNISTPLSEIVRRYAAQVESHEASVSIKEAYEKYLSKFSEKQVAQKKMVANRVGNFVAKFPAVLVNAITAKEVESYLNSYADWSAKTWNNHMTYIRTFLTWCCKRSVGFCRENPIADLELRPIERKRVQVLQPCELADILRAVLADRDRYTDFILLRFTLAYFCGMRSAEIMRQKLEDIRLDADTIVVTEAKGEQSGGAGRAFAIPSLARKWLDVIDIVHAYENPMCESGFSHKMSRLYAKLGISVPKNAGRHSFITYHIAAFGDPRKTEGIVGTSDSMRKDHYDARGLKREGEEYFSITPESVMPQEQTATA